jgi:hypothetical protein
VHKVPLRLTFERRRESNGQLPDCRIDGRFGPGSEGRKANPKLNLRETPAAGKVFSGFFALDTGQVAKAK